MHLQPNWHGMRTLFDHLRLIIEVEAHPAAFNMAVDQALLETTSVPVLRVYHWEQPSISIGYSHELTALRASLPDWPIVRRWTGGGVVWHHQDSTYSLTVPMSDPWAQTRPVESYRQIHGALAQCLNEAGHGPCRLAGEEDRKEGALCFEAPALFDIVRGTAKIAGAGQRRSRLGLLHQGSVKLLLPGAFWQRWAEQLAKDVRLEYELSPALHQRAEALCRARYGTDDWLQQR